MISLVLRRSARQLRPSGYYCNHGWTFNASEAYLAAPRPFSHAVTCRRGTSMKVGYLPAPRAACARGVASGADGTETASSTGDPSQSVPPFVVRTLLVGGAVGLMTPFFATAGVVRSWLSLRPVGPPGTYVFYAVSMTLFGGIGSLAMQTVLPFLLQNGNLVAPFALANGVAAASIYGAAEKWLGLHTVVNGDVRTLMRPLLSSLGIASDGLVAGLFGAMKLTGPLIGALTALLVPYVWPVAIQLCWSRELKEALIGNEFPWWLTEFAATFLWPLLVPIGAMAGFAIHHLLGPVLTGNLPGSLNGLPWTNVAAPLVAAIFAISGLYVAVSRVTVNDLYWISREDPMTGQEYSYHTKTKEWAQGPEKAQRAEMCRALLSTAGWLRMQPAQNAIAYGWHEVREQVWGIRKPRGKKTPKGEVQKLSDSMEQMHNIDVLLRLRYILDEEAKAKNPSNASRTPTAEEMIELGKEREQMLEREQGSGRKLIEALEAAEATVVAVQQNAGQDAERARKRLITALGGEAHTFDLRQFAEDYAHLLKREVPASSLESFNEMLRKEALVATENLRAVLRRGSSKEIRGALHAARVAALPVDAVAAGEEALRRSLAAELRDAAGAGRCADVQRLCEEARAAGVAAKPIEAARQRAARTEARTRGDVEAAVRRSSLWRLERSVARAKSQQLEGAWLGEADTLAKKLRRERDDKVAIVTIILFAAVAAGLAVGANLR